MHKFLRFAPVVFLPLAIALLNTGCYYDVAEELYPTTSSDSLIATWSGEVEPIIQENCALSGCHVNGTGLPALSTYTEVLQLVDAVEERAIVLKDMPPAGPLSQGDRDILAKWIAEGALEN